MKFFSIDSPLMVFLGKVADLMIVNMLTILCCLPIITIGPALTAAHYVCLKIVRNEECYIAKSYFKSFKANFKQGTIIWLILLAGILLLAGDYYIITKSGLEFNTILITAIIVAGVLLLMVTIFIFPALAKFDNSIAATFKNALLMSISQLPKTLLMAVLYVVPVVIAIFFYQTVPVVMVLGISVPIFLSAKLYNKFFQKIENNMKEAQAAKGSAEEEDDPDRIFSDKLDEALVEKNMNY